MTLYSHRIQIDHCAEIVENKIKLAFTSRNVATLKKIPAGTLQTTVLLIEDKCDIEMASKVFIIQLIRTLN